MEHPGVLDVSELPGVSELDISPGFLCQGAGKGLSDRPHLCWPARLTLGVMGQEVPFDLPVPSCLHLFAPVTAFAGNPLGMLGSELAPRAQG